MYSPAIAMLFGVICTTIVHVAKAMERQGIEIFDQIRAKVKDNENYEGVKGTKKPTIYIVGLILNQTPGIWAVLAGYFSGGNSSYYTSMFGIGLIVLLFYSRKYLGEKISKIEIIGAMILVSGTLVVGIENIGRPKLETSINLTGTWIFVGIYAIIGLIGVFFAYRKNKPLIVGILFGGFAGGSGSLDPIFKGIGQAYGVTESGILPDLSNPMAIFLWIISFAFGTCAFVLTQWGFAKKADATVLVPSYNTMYMIIPALIFLVAYPGEYYLTIYTMIGIILTILGIVMMQAFKQKKSNSISSEDIREFQSHQNKEIFPEKIDRNTETHSKIEN